MAETTKTPEQQLAELQKKYDGATKALEQKDAVIRNLKEENANIFKRISDEQLKNTDLHNQVEKLGAINGDLTKEIETLSKAPLAAAEKTFKLAGKEYGFSYPGVNDPKHGHITVDDVVSKKELQQHLVAIQSGFIYEK